MRTVPVSVAHVRAMLGPANRDVAVIGFEAPRHSKVWSRQCRSKACAWRAQHPAAMVTAWLTPIELPAGERVSEAIRQALEAVAATDVDDPLDHGDDLLEHGIWHCQAPLFAEVAEARRIPNAVRVVVEVPQVVRHG